MKQNKLKKISQSVTKVLLVFLITGIIVLGLDFIDLFILNSSFFFLFEEISYLFEFVVILLSVFIAYALMIIFYQELIKSPSAKALFLLLSLLYGYVLVTLTYILMFAASFGEALR